MDSLSIEIRNEYQAEAILKEKFLMVLLDLNLG